MFAHKIYHRVDQSVNEHLNHYIAVHTVKTSAALSKSAFVILSCKADQFSRSFMHAAVSFVELAALGRV